MLIRFEVANFRSLLEPVELSMVAVDRGRDGVTWVPNIDEGLVPVVGVYGPNASGKSNLLAAVEWLRDAVRNSLRDWDDDIPVEPFALAGAGAGPTEMTLEAVVDDVRYEYTVELDGSAVAYEALFHYPERRRRRVFERDGAELTLQRGLGGVSGTRELLTPQTLALSIARRFDEPVVSRFAEEILGGQVLPVSASTRTGRVPTTSTRRWFQTFDDESPSEPLSEDDRAQAVSLLRLADLGIDDVVIERMEAAPDDDAPRRVVRTRFVHRHGEERAQLRPSQESEGTRTWYALIGPVLSALRRGTLLLFDELDRSLHPTLCAQLLGLFRDPATNPRGAQLVFTAHDTSLLNHLNRDEVWLTEKDERGVTRLGALAEFAGERVRSSQNLERAYLHGRFGALPDTDRTEVLRALGLIG